MIQRAILFACGCLMLAITTCAVAIGEPAIATVVPLGQVIKQIPSGAVRPLSGRCQASLQIAELGGYPVLTITKRPKGRYIEPIEDVSGMAWETADRLVFTVSPIYGRPGVFVFSCSTQRIRRLVAPKTFGDATPDGADYFELQSLKLGMKGKIRFYYAPDIERIDFNVFPRETDLFEVNFDGTGFSRVAR